jgi:hypothetical protein
MRNVRYPSGTRVGSIIRVQILQSCQQSPNVFWIARMDQIKVEGGDGRALQDCSNAADYYITDLVMLESLKDG